MLLALCLLIVSGCDGRIQDNPEIKPVHTRDNERIIISMDAAVIVNLYGEGNSALLNQMENRVKQLEGRLSKRITGSDIDRLNSGNGSFVDVSSETKELLERAVEIAEETRGAFDPSLGRLTELWNISEGDVPGNEEIEAALGKTGTRFIVENEAGEFALENGVHIDLGAIGKGYIVESLKDMALSAGIKTGIISASDSSVAVIGPEEKGEFWNIMIRDPDGDSSEGVGIVALRNQAISNSGDYVKYFIKDGQRYHHILDPKTGRPAASNLRSVIVVADDSVICDSYSTALFVMGLEKGMDFYEKHRNFEAIFITLDKGVYLTPGLKEQFQFDGGDRGYYLAE